MNDSTVSLQINYTPSKFAPGVRKRFGKKAEKGQGGPKRGGGVDAFRAGEARMPRPNDQNYDGVDIGVKAGRAKWNRFKWALVCSNFVVSDVVSIGTDRLLIPSAVHRGRAGGL